VSDTSTVEVITVIEQFVRKWGSVKLPTRQISDHGTCYTFNNFEDYCSSRGIHHTLLSSRRPQTNGQVERVHSVILNMMITQLDDPKRWNELLFLVQSQINNSVSKTTESTPFDLMHGFNSRFHHGPLRELSANTGEWTSPEKLRTAA